MSNQLASYIMIDSGDPYRHPRCAGIQPPHLSNSLFFLTDVKVIWKKKQKTSFPYLLIIWSDRCLSLPGSFLITFHVHLHPTSYIFRTTQFPSIIFVTKLQHIISYKPLIHSLVFYAPTTLPYIKPHHQVSLTYYITQHHAHDSRSHCTCVPPQKVNKKNIYEKTPISFQFYFSSSVYTLLFAEQNCLLLCYCWLIFI